MRQSPTSSERDIEEAGSQGTSPREHRATETQTDERRKKEEDRPTTSYSRGSLEIEEGQQTSQFSAYYKIRDSLYPAALKGDWESANDIHKMYPELATSELPIPLQQMDDCPAPITIWELPITQQEMNALQVAVAAKQTTFVKKVLKCMTEKELKFTNANEDTALGIAALSGSVEIAKELVNKNNRLPMIRNKEKILPLITAAMHRQRDMVLYLYSETKFKELTRDERIELLSYVIFCDLHDIANEILEKDKTLAKDESGCIALEQLARKPLAIGSRSQMSAWERCTGYCYGLKGRVYDKALMRTSAHQLVEKIWKDVRKCSQKQLNKTIFLAAELGNVEFLAILIRSDPDLIWMVDENKQNIFHISTRYRQESIFNLIYEIGVFKDMIATNIDINKNNMLHLAGELAPIDRLNIVSGAALHMQKELLWFKEIEKIVPLAFLKAKNVKGQTPNDLFTKTHEKLHTDGEKWMRDTATQCMLVATLIATVVFAAAFTIPGGNDQGNGNPILLERNWFLVFFISDSIALLSSSTSILIFLSILTSRYTEKDFLSSLPRRLLFGLLALFISIVGMVVAFGATCFLIYQSEMTRIPTVIIALVSVPIFSFLLLHRELFSDIIISTFLPRFLFRSRKRMFVRKWKMSTPTIDHLKKLWEVIKRSF